MHHSTVISAKPTNTCISTDSMFLVRTRPPENSASAGTDINSTNAVQVSIQAVSPLFGTGVSAAQLRAGASAASTPIDRLEVAAVFGAVGMISPGFHSRPYQVDRVTNTRCTRGRRRVS